MNDRHPARRAPGLPLALAPRPLLLGALAGGIAALAACSHPFSTSADDLGEEVPRERLRVIRPLALDSIATSAQRADEHKGVFAPPTDPFAGADKRPLSLEEARAQMLRNNLNLRVSLVDPVIANERLSEEEAKFEAVLFTNARLTQLDQPVSTSLAGSNVQAYSFTPGVRVPLRSGGTAIIDFPTNRDFTDNEFTDPSLNPSWTSDIRFSISQPLLRNAGRRAATYSIRIQSYESRIAQAQAKLEVIRRLADVDKAYWTLYATQRLLEVRQAQFELAKEQLERAERRVRAKAAPEVEIVRAQSGLADRLEQIILALNEVRRAQRLLKKIINIPGLDVDSPTMLELGTAPDPVRYELDSSLLAAEAVENRMEMLQLELRLAQDYSTIEFQKNQALPQFVLDFSYTINGLGNSLLDSVQLLRGNDFEDWSAGVNFETPLGNEAAESRVHAAILRRLQRLASRDAQEQSIRQEVYDALDGLDASWQRILAARQSVLLAARVLAGEQRQFEVGARTSTDVLDAAARLADAQSNEIRALANYQIALVDLAFATGTLLGAAKVEWEPNDPRGPDDQFGDTIWTTPPPDVRDWDEIPRRLPVAEEGTPPAPAPASGPSPASSLPPESAREPQPAAADEPKPADTPADTPAGTPTP